MSSSGLFQSLVAIHPLSDDFKDSLEKELVSLSLPKNHVLLEAPRIAEYAYFIKSGFAMSYSHQDGKKIIESFWKPGQIMTIPGSFYDQAPSTETIQLMEKSDLICLSHASLHRLFEKHHTCTT